MKTFTYLSLGFLATLTTLSSAQIQNGNNCTVFNWDQQPGYLINGTTSRVSAASTCGSKQNETHDCPITASGDLQASFTYNISSILRDGVWNSRDGAQSFIHGLILGAVNSSLNGAAWDNYAIGIIDTTQALSPGTSGYIDFTALRRCFEGTMSGCGGGLRDGLAIQACAPVTTPIRGASSPPILDGFYTIVQIPEGDVARYRDPYSGQSRGDAGDRIFKSSASLLVTIVALVMAMLML